MQLKLLEEEHKLMDGNNNKIVKINVEITELENIKIVRQLKTKNLGCLKHKIKIRKCS